MSEERDVNINVQAHVDRYRDQLRQIVGITESEAAKAAQAFEREFLDKERRAVLSQARAAAGLVEEGTSVALREIGQFERVGRIAGGTIGELSGAMADFGDIVEAGISPVTAVGLGVGVAAVAMGALTYGAINAAQAAAALVRDIKETGAASGQAAEDIGNAADALDGLNAVSERARVAVGVALAPAVERGAELLIGMAAKIEATSDRWDTWSNNVAWAAEQAVRWLVPGGQMLSLLSDLSEASGFSPTLEGSLQRTADLGAEIVDRQVRLQQLGKDFQRHLDLEEQALERNARQAAEEKRERERAAADARRQREEAARERERDAVEAIRLAEQQAAAQQRAIAETASIERAAASGALSAEGQIRQAYSDRIDRLVELAGVTQDFGALASASAAVQSQLERDLTDLHNEELAARTEADRAYWDEQQAQREAAREATERATEATVQAERGAALAMIGTVEALAQAAIDGANTRTEAGRRAARAAYTISRLAAATEIGVNTAIGVSQALELPPPAVPFAVFQAVATGAAAGARLAAVPAPKFHSGGEVMGGQEVRAVLERGEVVVPRSRVSDLGGAAAVDRQLRGSSNQTVVQVNVDGEVVELLAAAVERRMNRPNYGRGN